MSLVPWRTGSAAIAASMGACGSNPVRRRPRVTARSKRKPSTPISVTQYRSESSTIRCTTGLSGSRVLPQPVVSKYRDASSSASQYQEGLSMPRKHSGGTSGPPSQVWL